MITTIQPRQKLGRNYFLFNKNDNGGEAFTISTEIFAGNDDSNPYVEQKFELGSYCNSAIFSLGQEFITPDDCRKLANELDRKWAQLKSRNLSSTSSLLDSHRFVFTLTPSGDNTLLLITQFYDNGDGVPEGVYTNQKLVMQSHGKEAYFNLCGASISSTSLRQLANELDSLLASIPQLDK